MAIHADMLFLNCLKTSMDCLLNFLPSVFLSIDFLNKCPPPGVIAGKNFSL